MNLWNVFGFAFEFRKKIGLSVNTHAEREQRYTAEMSTDQDWIGLDQDWSHVWLDQDWIGL